MVTSIAGIAPRLTTKQTELIQGSHFDLLKFGPLKMGLAEQIQVLAFIWPLVYFNKSHKLAS